MLDSIKIIDNFFEEKLHKKIHYQCLNSVYIYGEADNRNTPPTGMVSNISDSDEMYKIFSSKILEKFPEMVDRNLYRMYINCFAPSENPYFHVDGPSGGVTFLYYPNISWNINDGGETQILIDNQISGILPLPNRIIKFDAALLHKATTFRNTHRFTIAIKYV